MSRTLGPILNPQATEAMAITLGRKAFLRELLFAALLSLTLPMVSIVGVYFAINRSAMNPIGLVLGVVVVSALTAIPLIFYASLRLNAATLARERASAGVPEQLIHKPLKGPLLLRRSIVAGSVRSRIIAGFPVCIGFGIQFALMACLTNSIGFLVLHVPIGAMLAVQIVIAANLLR